MHQVISGFSFFIKKPFLLLASFIASLLNIGIFLALSNPIIDAIIDIFIGGALPKATFIEMPKALITTYPNAVLFAIAIFILSAAIHFFLYQYYALSVNEKKVDFTLLIKNSLLLAIFFVLIEALFGLTLLGLFELSVFSGIVSLIISGLFMLIVTYVYFRALFTPYAMTAHNLNLKKAILKSFELTKKSKLNLLGFLIVLFVITGLLSSFLMFIAGIFEENIAFALIMGLAMTIPNAYPYIALSLFAKDLE